MRLQRRLGMVLLGLWAIALPGQGTVYEPLITRAQWEMSGSRVECRLRQSIPHLGLAEFRRRAGETPRFRLRVRLPQLGSGTAELALANPEWRLPAEEPLGTVTVHRGDWPIRLDQQQTTLLLAALYNGQQAVFSQWAWYREDKTEQVEVALSPVNFRPAYDRFQACVAGLLPYNFDQIKRTALYFPEETVILTDSAKAKLDRIFTYLKYDPKIGPFYVDGHTDASGTRTENLDLSQQRAELVAQYLQERGIKPQQIVTRWHGERYPVGDNRNAEGRAMNRRVTIRIER